MIWRDSIFINRSGKCNDRERRVAMASLIKTLAHEPEACGEGEPSRPEVSLERRRQINT